MTSTQTAPTQPPPTEPNDDERRVIPLVAQRGHRLRWSRLVVTALIVVVAAEAGTRLLASDLPPVLAWPTLTLVRHEQQLAARGDLDLLVVGSSSVGAAIQPDQLTTDKVVGPGYNYWLAGPPMRAIDELTTTVLLRRSTPDLVIIGITMREFNNTEATAATLRALDESPGFRAAAGKDSWIDRIDDFLQTHSELARRRDLVRDPAGLIKQFGQPAPTPQTLAPDGALLDMANRNIADEPPAHTEQERHVLANYVVSTTEIAALHHLLTELHTQGITTLVINLPVSTNFIQMAPHTQTDYNNYLTAIHTTTTQTHTHFLDTMTQPWPNQYFADVNHLNNLGQQRLHPTITTTLANLQTAKDQ